MPEPISCTINGSPFTLNLNDLDDVTRAQITLLDVLRDHAGITSPKNGCQPQAQCGCCTVLVDNKPLLSCTLRPERFNGKEITTLEGLPEDTRQSLANSFVSQGGVQCGFCIPGIAVRAVALCANSNKPPSRDEIAKSLRPHLCRCTGYQQIIDAIEHFASGQTDEATCHSCTGNGTCVGSALPRYEGAAAVLGDKPFVDDMTVPTMLHGSVRLTDHARAGIKRIDASQALQLPGVHAVLTAADVPGDRVVGLIEKDWPILVSEGEMTRCVGDILAVVAADTPQLARHAADLIQVEYDPIETPVTDPLAALQPDAPLVHPHRKTNLLSTSVLKSGDIESAFKSCAHIIEDTYHTQRIEHLYLEPESCLAVPTTDEAGRPDSLHVYSQGQGVFDDRRQIASVLAIPEDSITVELVSNGGAFGGKEDMSIQAQTALLAWAVGRPVKLTLTRSQSMAIHPKRHPISMSYKVGCDADGRLLAVQSHIIGDTGAYASVGAKVLERAGGHCAGPYRVPNLDVEAKAVYTNNPPCGAMRGFGANQAAFAIESLLDRLAEQVGIDGYDIRDRNILEPGDAFATGQLLDKPFGLRQTLEAVREQYKSAKYAGIACGIKNVGIGNGMPDIGRAALTVNDDGTIHIRTGFTEMGQGLFTVCVQYAADVTGLPPDTFTVSTDTTFALGCGQTTASRATVLAGNAILDAGAQLRARLDTGTTLDDLAGHTFIGEWICDDTTKFGTEMDRPGGPKTHFTYGFATQLAILDEKTGRLIKMIAAHDVGKAVNPTQLAGQIYGSLHMGIGYALTEDLPVDAEGRLIARRINDCGVLRAHQMPEMEVIIVEEPEPDGPHGARGVGEIGLVPTAPAIANAMYQFDRVARRSLPMTDSPAAHALKKSGK
ncbi:MAG: selenium-dependent xanthine dehydrogenase [Planctomycetes bacterium]|nr:selenium-dependent xanthine dehydrogenase [Planctomycetota bacterium]NOG52951.1 selenium-dependent xanthine dehydrogenase [Planctomycetota bacterium]